METVRKLLSGIRVEARTKLQRLLLQLGSTAINHLRKSLAFASIRQQRRVLLLQRLLPFGSFHQADGPACPTRLRQVPQI